MTEPHEIAAPDDTGGNTLARFEYQAHATFPYLLELVRGERVTAVFAEHIEDIAVQEQASWRFLQVKSRDPGRGPWTLSEAVQAGVIRSLWRAYQSVGATVKATYELLLEGAVLNKDVLSAVVAGDDLDARFLTRLAQECGVEVDQVEDFAARLRVRELPPLGSIVADNILLLAKAAPPSFATSEIRQLYKTAVAAIDAAMKADRLEGNWPGALLLDADERSRLRLMAKRIDRDRAQEIFAPILRAAATAISPVVPPPPVRSVPFVLPQIDVPTFTGRSGELERLESILLRNEGEKISSIAGVSGAGGIGKSALACHFAELHREAFPAGVIGLRVDGREPISIARDFAGRAFVEIDPDDERDAPTIMQEVFRERRALLIFDNAEDVSIRALLPGGPHCAVIITTRDRGLPVSLGVPSSARLDLSPLPPDEAIALLERLVGERAVADPDAAGRICTLVGNLPLAIQIAGATLQMQPWHALSEYADALREEKKRLSLLRVRGDSELDVRASFSLSLRVLEPAEIDFFACLAVCAQDGFSVMSAGAANGCDERTAQDRLAYLFRLSLVNSSAEGTVRFVLHPLIRLFAREKAEESEMLAAAEKRHREFYAGLVKARDLSDPLMSALLGREIDDIVTAAESMGRAGLRDDAFVIRLQPFFQRYGHWEKAANIFAAALEPAEESKDWSAVVQLRLQQAKFLTLRGKLADAERLLTDLDTIVILVETAEARTRLMAMVLNSLGGVLQRQSKYDEGVDALRRSYELSVSLDDARGQAMLLNSLGGVLQRQGKFDEAVDAFRKSYALEIALNNTRGQAMMLNSLGGVLQRQGNFEEAADAFRKSYALEIALDNARGQAMVLNSLGGVLQRQGKFDEAVDTFRNSYALEIALDDTRGQAMLLNSLGGALQRQGKFDEAVDAFRRSHAISEQLNDQRSVAMVLNSLGGVLQRQGKFDGAVDAFHRGYELLVKLDDARGQAMVLNSLGGVLQRQGKFDEAVDAFQSSYELLVSLDDARGQAMVLNSLGGVLQRQGKFDEAVDAFRRSYAISEQLGDQRSLAMVLNSLGGVLQRQGKFDEAVDAFRRSYAISEQLGDERSLAMVLNSLGGTLQRQGKFDEAADAFRKSYVISKQLDDQHSLAMVLNSLGGVLQRQGKFDEAVEACRQSLTISEQLGDEISVAMRLNSLGGALQRQGKFDEAVDAFHRSLAISDNLGDQRSVAMVLNSLGGVLQRQGKFDEAVDAFHRSYELLVTLEDARGQAMVLNSIGGTLQRLENLDEAFEAFRKSIAIGEDLGDKRHLAMAHTAFGRALLTTDRKAAAVELGAGFEIDVMLKNRKGVGFVAPILIDTLVKLGRIAEALDVCDRALALLPQSVRLLRVRRDLDGTSK